MDNKQQSPRENQPSQMPKISWIWWVVMLALIVWNIWVFRPKSQPNANIPYSTFLDQIKSGNVNKVTISGSSINGTFVTPVLWPPQSSNPAPTQTQSQNPAIPVFGGSTQPQKYTDFSTNFPDTVGDTGLMPLLEAHNVTVDVTAPSSPWLVIILTDGLPLILLVLVMVWLGRRATQSQSGVFNFGRSKPREYNVDRPRVTFNDVAGADEAKNELQEVVDFLRHPKKYHDLGARIPRGVLLVGPPGTGKTLMARAVAGEAGVPFFSISASEFVEMFVGVGASRVRDLFEKAKATAPGIVFIDELDAVGRRRGAGLGAVNDEREQTLNQLLVEMDGFDEHHEVIVLAATNRPDVLDPAILRPGRFDREITVGLPDRQGREGILRIHTKQLTLDADVNLDLLARTTTGFSGADLANLSNEAALVAARENHVKVNMADFEEALDRVLLGAARTLLLNDHDRQVVAYHEAGHALVAWLTPAADPVHKVTIIPRGRALGVTEQLPGEDHYNYTREYLMARLAVMLGGRSAEELTMDDITTGAENDLIEASRLARRMITRWGMGSLGLMALNVNEEQPFLGYEISQGRDYSEETAARIDVDVQRLLEERHEFVQQLLADARGKLDQLVQVLLQEETIDQNDMIRILGPRIFSDQEETMHPVEILEPHT
jgi:cell division protease FtsH